MVDYNEGLELQSYCNGELCLRKLKKKKKDLDVENNNF